MSSDKRARSSTLILLVLIVIVVATSCVGPSRTQSDYERKVANTAQAVVSSIESALRTVEVAADQLAPSRYVSLHLSETEEGVSAVETGFGAVQPPDPHLDELRAEVLTVIGQASDVLEELRIAAYRGQLDLLPELAGGLKEPLKRLRGFMEIAPT